MVGALLAGAAAAFLSTALGTDRPADAAALAVPDSVQGFLGLVSGIMVTGAVLVVLGVRSGVGWVGGAMILVVGYPVLNAAGWLETVGFTVGFVVFGLLVTGSMRWLRPGRLVLLFDRILDPEGRAGATQSRDWTHTPGGLLAITGTLLAVTVPHLLTVLGGTVAAAIGGGWLPDLSGRRRWLLLGCALPLILALVWSLRLAGPLGGWIPNLVDGPFSPRAAILLAFLGVPAIFALAGLWPLHGGTIPVLLTPSAWALGGGWAGALVPDGLEYWQPLTFPVTLVGMVHALASRRFGVFTAAAGILGVWAADSRGLWGGGILIGYSWFLTVASVTWLGRPPWPPMLIRLLGIFPVVGAALLIPAVLKAEVVYGLVGIAIAAGAIAIFLSELRPPVAASLGTGSYSAGNAGN